MESCNDQTEVMRRVAAPAACCVTPPATCFWGQKAGFAVVAPSRRMFPWHGCKAIVRGQVRLWDTLFADAGGRTDCLLRVCTAMLLNVREELLQVPLRHSRHPHIQLCHVYGHLPHPVHHHAAHVQNEVLQVTLWPLSPLLRSSSGLAPVQAHPCLPLWSKLVSSQSAVQSSSQLLYA